MVTVLVRQATTGSGELSAMLDRADRVAGAADRLDLVDRLDAVRSRLAARSMRIGVTAGAGTDPLVRVLRAVSERWLPGTSFVDVPGSPGLEGAWWVDAFDVVLVVADAAREYGPAELDMISLLRDEDARILGILTNYENCPDLPALQQANRALLQAADLDSPPLPLLPVSATMCENGWRRDDEEALVASGVPQLLEFLRDRVDTGVDRHLRDVVVGEICAVVEQILPERSDELARCRADVGSPQRRKKKAVRELELGQQRSAAWQLALSDGSTEMNALLDFDLRERLRDVLAYADDQITNGDPFADWAAFDAAIQTKVDIAATANYQVLRERTKMLARTVAVQLAGSENGSFAGVPLPKVAVDDPDAGLDKLTPSVPPQGGGTLVSRIVNSVRGSYGGILMVGVLTSLAGEKLISVYSVGAGVLLGLFTFFEDRKTTRERRRADGKAAVAKRLDEANFRLGDHQRGQLRSVHRTLRNHFSAVNDERLRVAADAVRTAADVRDDAGGRARIADLEAEVAELTELGEQVGADAPTARHLGAVAI